VTERTIVRLTADHLKNPVFYLEAPTTYENARDQYPLLFPVLVFRGGASSWLLHVPGHGLGTGQPVAVRPIGGGVLPYGLEPYRIYYVLCDSDTDCDHIKLSAKPGAKAIELAWKGDQENELFVWGKTEPLAAIRPVAGPSPVVRKVGEMLLSALRVHPAVSRHLDEVPTVLTDSQRQICLFFDDPSGERFPWEAMFYDDKVRFLALDQRFPIVRLKDPLSLARVFAYDPPLRILALLAAVGPNVNARDEWDGLYQATKGKDVRVEVLTCQKDLIEIIKELDDPRYSAEQIASESNVAMKLNNFVPQILHLFGHGNAAEGEIVFGTFGDWKENEDPDRQQDQPGTIKLTPMNISQYRNRAMPVWLAVLNACRSGGIEDGHESLASALVRSGFPAAVGMSSDVASYDTSAFTKTYYSRVMDLIASAKLGERVEIDWASRLWDARMAIYKGSRMKDEECPYWTFPVIYTRREPFQVFRLANDIETRPKTERPSLDRTMQAQIELDQGKVPALNTP
jgi:hypothetical protein